MSLIYLLFSTIHKLYEGKKNLFFITPKMTSACDAWKLKKIILVNDWIIFESSSSLNSWPIRRDATAYPLLFFFLWLPDGLLWVTQLDKECSGSESHLFLENPCTFNKHIHICTHEEHLHYTGQILKFRLRTKPCRIYNVLSGFLNHLMPLVHSITTNKNACIHVIGFFFSTNVPL